MNLNKSLLNFYVLYWLKQLMHNFPFEKEDIKKNQNRKLKNLVFRAYKIPFYKNRFDKVGIIPSNVESIEDLKDLPVLKKEEYRAFIEEEVKKNPKVINEWYRDGTSGSTGLPLTIYRPWKEQAYIMAKWLRELMLNGYNPIFDKVFSAVSPHRIRSRDSFLQKFGLFRRDVVSYLAPPSEMVKKFQENKPDLFYSNKSQLVQMADYAINNSIDLWKPKSYACGAETLDENSFNLISSCFGKEGFFETYGSVEMGILGFQLKGNRDFFHFCHDTNILEIETHDKLEENIGRAIITDLHQHSFPLIRYDMGDKLKLDCVNDLSVIKKIYGRDDDWILFKNGEKIPFHFFYEIMERRPEISQFRIIQESLSLINIQLVLGNSSDKNAVKNAILNDIRKEIKQEGVDYQFEWRNEIPPDPNGKLRMIVSKLKI